MFEDVEFVCALHLSEKAREAIGSENGILKNPRLHGLTDNYSFTSLLVRVREMRGENAPQLQVIFQLGLNTLRFKSRGTD